MKEVLAAPSAAIQELFDELEYEPEPVALPEPVGTLTVRTVDEIPIELLSLLEDAKAEISGRRVWPGSVLLCLGMVQPRFADTFKGASVLELGAGTGLSSMVAVRLGGRLVVCTDGDQSSVDLSQQNLSDNGIVCGDGSVPLVLSKRLLWGQTQATAFRKEIEGSAACPEGGYDVILAADVMYKDELIHILFESVKVLMASEGTCLLCHLVRAGVSQELVVAAAVGAGLEVEDLPLPAEHLPHGHCSKAEADGARLYILSHAQ